MTKRELQSSSKDLVKIGESKEFRAMLETAREECPYIDSRSIDPTGIINNEGKMRGWMECLAYLKTVWKPEAEKPKAAPTRLYPDPDLRKQPPPQSDKNRP